MLSLLASALTTESLTDPEGILELGRGVFALVLFSVSLYAWYRRRQPALVIVSVAFLLFFVKTVLDFVLVESTTSEFSRLSMDFVALALFFVAIVIRPRKEDATGSVVRQRVEP